MAKVEQDQYDKFPGRLYPCCCAFLDSGFDQIIEQCGAFSEIKEAGCHPLCCCFHKIAYVIDKREIVLTIREGEGQTKDNVAVKIKCSITVKFWDAKKAAQGAKEPLRAIREFSRAVIRSAIGKMDLNTIFENRNAVTKEVMETMSEAVDEWGANITRFQLTMVEPADPTVASAMHKQAAAEREKNETIIKSEATKAEMIQQAEASLYEIVVNAKAYENRQIKEGEGDKEKILRHAEGEKQSIQLISKGLEIEGGDQSQRMRLSQQYLRQFGNIARTCNTMIVPENTGGYVDAIRKASELFGKK